MTRIARLLILSVVLAFASVTAERTGPSVIVSGEGFCGETPREPVGPCGVEALAGGWPLPYLVDNPQISVPNALHIVEDDFRPVAFLADVAFCFALVLAASAGLRRVRRMA